MRYSTIFIFAFLIVLFVIGCDNPTESEENSIFGKWIPIKTEYYDGEKYIIKKSYDPSFDNYYHAEIYEITQEKMFVYENYHGLEYKCDHPWDLTFTDDMITYSDEYYEDGETYTVSFNDYYYFDGNRLVFKDTCENIDEYGTYIWYHEKYKGDFPPDSWTTELENDGFEPDNDVQNSNSITVGGNYQKHVITSGDIDWFKFQANPNNTYMIKILGHMDNVLTLYDKDGESEIAEDDDNYWNIDVSGNVESVLVWDCESSGTYYFEVTGYSDENEGYYSAEVTLTDIESPLSKLGKNIENKNNNKTHTRFHNIIRR